MWMQGMYRAFQSTLPSRGATLVACSIRLSDCWISIHAPLAGSDLQHGGTDQHFAISIHAPLAGSDIILIRFWLRVIISIHAPLAGSDVSNDTTLWTAVYFNPRSPRGERRWRVCRMNQMQIFQSTLPSRGATDKPTDRYVAKVISIHAPLAGSDLFSCPLLRRIRISIHAPLAGSDSNFSQKTWKSYTKIYLNCILFKNTIHFYFF